MFEVQTEKLLKSDDFLGICDGDGAVGNVVLLPASNNHNIICLNTLLFMCARINLPA